MQSDPQIMQTISLFINHWYATLLPVTLGIIFRKKIKQLLVYISIKWDNNIYSSTNGEIYESGFWWRIKKIHFSYIKIQRKDDNKKIIKKIIPLSTYWNAKITYREEINE